MKYRPEVDGLRALAVIPVILFHAGFSLFSGGFVGVDIFFVISGYLITTILIEELDNDKFSIVNFYERRARRILPALSLIMLLCIPVAWMTMSPENHKEFLNSLVAVSLFCSNILFWMESGYFEAASEEKPLLHTWSLAVEEQYYLLFPVFLFLFWRLGKNRVLILIALMTAFSLLLTEWGWRNNSTMNFFLAPFRAWELFAGSMVAFFIVSKGVQKNNLLGIIGLLMVLYANFSFDKFTPFPSFYALFPVVGTSLIILYSGPGTLVNRLLSLNIFVWIGLISYSAYLWHQPIFAFARILSPESFSTVQMLVLITVSLVLAWFSWRYVEGPFRRRENIGRKGIFVFSGCVMAFFICYGSIASHFAPALQTGKYNSLENFSLSADSKDNRELREISWEYIKSRDEGELWFDDSAGQKVLIIGNSHSKDVFNALSASAYAESEYQFARKAIRKFEVDDVIEELLLTPNFKEADIVMIASRYHAEDVEPLQALLSFILEAGKQPVVLTNIHEFPEYWTRKWTLAEFIGYTLRRESPNVSNEELAATINRAYFNAVSEHHLAERIDFSGNVNEINRTLAQLPIEVPGVIVLNRMDYICDTESQYCDAVGPDLEKYFYDYGHNTLAGAKKFAENIDRVQWLSPLREQQ